MAKAVISSTYDDKYLYFIPIVTWCWNKLGVDVICFMPAPNVSDMEKLLLISNTMGDKDMKFNGHYFSMPEHKQATAAQCSRLYGACLDLPEDEVLITGDVDMAVFKLPMYGGTGMGVVGLDLVPKGQAPICYIYGTANEWNKRFNPDKKSYQECLDEQLGWLEAESFRGNFWSRDQELAYNKIFGGEFPLNYATLMPRSNGQNQFAQNRYDRDDQFILDRLSPDTIDFHMNRPGYEDKNFEIILTILKYHFPDENFDWLISYNNAYKQLL